MTAAGLSAARQSAAGDAGCARVLSWSGSAWSQVGSDMSGRAGGGNFSGSASLSAGGKVVAVGDPQPSCVRALERGGCSWWSPLGNDMEGQTTGGSFGNSASLSEDGNAVAIGASRWSLNAGVGYARVLAWDGSVWRQLGSDLNGGFVGDTFGFSVSLSADGAVVAVGTKSTNSGHVSVFGWTGI